MNRALAAVAAVTLMVIAPLAYAGYAKGAVAALNGRNMTVGGTAVNCPAPAAGAPDMCAGIANGQTWEMIYTTAGTPPVNTVTKAVKK